MMKLNLQLLLLPWRLGGEQGLKVSCLLITSLLFLDFLKPRQSLSPSRVHRHPICTCSIRVFTWCLLPLPLPFTPLRMINGTAVGLTPSSVRFKSVTCFRRELVSLFAQPPSAFFFSPQGACTPPPAPSTALFQTFFLPKELEPISHVINSSI